MNAHVSNFLEALTFADECGIDTAALRADAAQLVETFVSARASQVANHDGLLDAGCSAFEFGLALTIEYNMTDWIQLHANSVRDQRGISL